MCFIKVYFKKTFLDNSPIQRKIFDESILEEKGNASHWLK